MSADLRNVRVILSPVDDEAYLEPHTTMLFGDAKGSVARLIHSVESQWREPWPGLARIASAATITSALRLERGSASAEGRARGAPRGPPRGSRARRRAA